MFPTYHDAFRLTWSLGLAAETYCIEPVLGTGTSYCDLMMSCDIITSRSSPNRCCWLDTPGISGGWKPSQKSKRGMQSQQCPALNENLEVTGWSQSCPPQCSAQVTCTGLYLNHMPEALPKSYLWLAACAEGSKVLNKSDLGVHSQLTFAACGKMRVFLSQKEKWPAYIANYPANYHSLGALKGPASKPGGCLQRAIIEGCAVWHFLTHILLFTEKEKATYI